MFSGFGGNRPGGGTTRTGIGGGETTKEKIPPPADLTRKALEGFRISIYYVWDTPGKGVLLLLFVPKLSFRSPLGIGLRKGIFGRGPGAEGGCGKRGVGAGGGVLGRGLTGQEFLLPFSFELMLLNKNRNFRA